MDGAYYSDDDYEEGWQLWNEWLLDEDKADWKYFDNEIFREIYSRETLLPYAYRVRSLLQDKFLEDVAYFKGQKRVLSLGCGPGSDLLGFFMSAAKDKSSRVRIDAVGVDLLRWNTEYFEEQVDELPKKVDVHWTFDWGTSMEQYARTPRTCRSRFHVILLTYVDIQHEDTMRFLCDTVVNNLLAKEGRIYVIDNDIANVRNLRNFGFEFVGRNDTTVAYMYQG